MPSTRYNTDGIFRQERFASSPEYDRCLKSNLVAARAALLESVTAREACFFIQAMSMKPGGLAWLAPMVTPGLYAKPNAAEWLAAIALDPGQTGELMKALPMLREVMADVSRQCGETFAETQISRTIGETLDYCASQKCLVMIEGRARIGKTKAAKIWANQRPGRARYVEVPASGDELSFFVAIARALGVAVTNDPKVKRLRPRVEEVLQHGDLMLILDEAASLWPATNYRQQSRPPRISWLLQMVNQGASFAMLVTPNNWTVSRQNYVQKSRWQDAQLIGRIERHVILPDTLSTNDLERVALAWLPSGSRREIEVLADTAALSQKYLAAITHAVKQAAFIARQDCRENICFDDVCQAVKSSLSPGDETLAAAVKASRSRNAPASLPR